MHKTIQNLKNIQKNINLVLDTLKINKIPKISLIFISFALAVNGPKRPIAAGAISIRCKKFILIPHTLNTFSTMIH